MSAPCHQVGDIAGSQQRAWAVPPGMALKMARRLTYDPVPDHLEHEGIEERGDGGQLLQLERDLLFIDFDVIEDAA